MRALCVVLLLAVAAGCIHYNSKTGWGLGDDPETTAREKAREKEVRRADQPGELFWTTNGWQAR